MSLLSLDQLEELEERLNDELSENLMSILTRLNRAEKLGEFLSLLGLSSLLIEEPRYKCYDNGTIIVIGASKVSEDDLKGVAKSMGFDKRRFEFYLDYDDGKKFDPRTIQWNPAYSLVMVGPMPHSGIGKGDFGSVISAMEQSEGYPPVVRLGTANSLRISKSDFRAKLQEACDRKLIAVM